MPLPPFELHAGMGVLPDPVRLSAGGVPGSELSVQALMDLAQQADFFVALGQDDAAVDLLMRLVRRDAQTGAMPYLKLLKIYRRRGEHEAYGRIRERFNRRFNVSAPHWASFANDASTDSGLGRFPGPRMDSRHVDVSPDASGPASPKAVTLEATPAVPATQVSAPAARADVAEIDLLLPMGVQHALMSCADFPPWVIRTDVDLDLSEPSAYTFVPSDAPIRPTTPVKTRDYGSSAFER